MPAKSPPADAELSPTALAAVPVAISAHYIKDFSFESPHAPQIFAPSPHAPDLQMGFNILTRTLMEKTYEVVLAIKMETKIDDNIAFIAELAYAGIFIFPELPEQQLKAHMLIECPRLLFPFARAILMTAIRDGGFPQVMINPIDFAELYAASSSQGSMRSTAGMA